MKKNIWLISGLLAMLSFNAFSKSKGELTKQLKQSDIRISLQNAGIGMPPHFVNGRLHPGFELGIVHDLKTKHKKSYLNYNVLLGYFAQQSLQRNLYLKPGIGYSISLYKQIRIRPVVNLSLLGVQQINKEFKLNAQGEYEQAHRNRFQLMPSLGIELLIPTAQSKNLAYQTILAYHFGVQLPFSSISSILPINQIQIGVQIKHKK